jgi:hypothetical protein
LGTILGNYFNDEMQRTLLKDMEKKGVISVPYVNIHGDVPDGGFPLLWIRQDMRRVIQLCSMPSERLSRRIC